MSLEIELAVLRVTGLVSLLDEKIDSSGNLTWLQEVGIRGGSESGFVDYPIGDWGENGIDGAEFATSID